MASATPQTIWNTISRARLFRVLAVYLGACLVALEVVDIFTQQLGLPDWFFPGAAILLVIGLQIVSGRLSSCALCWTPIPTTITRWATSPTTTSSRRS